MKINLIHSDSLEWISKQEDRSVENFVTGVPDLDEMNMSIEEYLEFFEKITSLIFQKQSYYNYCIFIQTDRKYNKVWYDKSYLISKIANKHGFDMKFHKIVLLRNVGKIDLFRPTYSHILCYSKYGTSGKQTADVIGPSKRMYKNGTPLLASKFAIDFIKKYSKNKKIIDPFCGRGSIGLICKENNIDYTGIDIDKDQINKSKELLFD